MASLTLHTYKLQRTRATMNRVHIFFHSTATLALLYYRVSHLFYGGHVPILPWGLITLSELIFAFVWFLSQAFRWRPVIRTATPDNMPAGIELPGLDVFICTAGPRKEPTMELMNTVLLVMALDYQPEKLAVYLPDDGGSPVTLHAIKEACSFARSWLPFCRKYGIKNRCPQGYFSSLGDDERFLRSNEFKAEEQKIKAKYEMFKKNVEKASGCEDSLVNDRPPRVEVICDHKKDGVNDDQIKMPLLVYVSREKRPSHPHRFKAGALNTLLRVSGIMSNGPYVLVLDCDMYCNDPTFARQAMCFHLDPKMSSSLAFVQYPQIFHNVSKNDIYDGQARSAYKDPENNFGLSSKFIASLKRVNKQYIIGEGIPSDTLREARNLASCTFEKGTKWGKEIANSYDSLLESTFTGYLLHSRGWRSAYLYPERASFLGCTTMDMKRALVQQMKWSSGQVHIWFSRFSPLTYGISRMSTLQSMCYGYFTFFSLQSFAFLLYGTVPQLCLLNGIPLYPKVSSPWFAVFATIYVSALLQHLYEVLSSGGSIRAWWNEQRIWMIKSVTACLFGCMDVLLKWVGITQSSFRLTNKAIDQEKMEKYKKGQFDFKGAEVFMIPLRILVLLNMVCFILGGKMVMVERNLGEMFGQVFVSSLILILSFPILEGMVPRKGK